MFYLKFCAGEDSVRVKLLIQRMRVESKVVVTDLNGFILRKNYYFLAISEEQDCW